MPINELSQWKLSLKEIKPSHHPDWPQIIAQWTLKNATGMNLSVILPATFTFNAAVFAQALKAHCRPTENQQNAARNLAMAWSQAIDASQMSVTGGMGFGFTAIVGRGTPLNTQSAATLVEKHLANAPTVIDNPLSHLADALRAGFMALQYQVTGVGIPPSAPFPPTAPFVGVSGIV